MDKLFVEISSFEKFKTLKLSSSELNDSWHYYESDVDVIDNSTIDILWNQICFIADVNLMYVRNKLYGNTISSIKDVKLDEDENGLCVISNTNTEVGVVLATDVAVELARTEKVMAGVSIDHNNRISALEDISNNWEIYSYRNS